ncbi:LysR family transcriptional regulator [Vibrio sp. WXL103]|uniref:LysR family transcriptional regulator n=1 Tax=Vibrio sp. WXL103 TaxID=3450710 RepID=UPI003EC8EF3B
MLQTMNIEHIYYFVTVVETNSITQAARQLKRDRTTISNAISNLEADLDLTLFTRQGRSIKLTPVGQDLYRHARNLVLQHQSFYNHSLSLQANIESQLNIGYDNFVSSQDIVKIERAIYSRFPNTQLHWHYVDDKNNFVQLQKGRLDLCYLLFKNQDVPEVIQAAHLKPTNLIAVASPRQYAYIDEVRSFNSLRNKTLIAFNELENAIRLDRIPRVQNVGTLEQVIRLLQVKPSWALAPESAVREDIALDKLMQINLDITQGLPIQRVMTWKMTSEIGQVKRWLIDNSAELLN